MELGEAVQTVVGDNFCRYIERFAELGITSGCRADDTSTPECDARERSPCLYM